LDRHVANDAGDFAADFGHVRREERALQVDFALHRNFLQLRRLNGDSGTASAAAPAASPAAARPAGTAASGRVLTRRHQCRQEHHQT
jgi:hypothetical protein